MNQYTVFGILRESLETYELVTYAEDPTHASEQAQSAAYDAWGNPNAHPDDTVIISAIVTGDIESVY